jgi:hypothetical protein
MSFGVYARRFSLQPAQYIMNSASKPPSSARPVHLNRLAALVALASLAIALTLIVFFPYSPASSAAHPQGQPPVGVEISALGVASTLSDLSAGRAGVSLDDAGQATERRALAYLTPKEPQLLALRLQQSISMTQGSEAHTVTTYLNASVQISVNESDATKLFISFDRFDLAGEADGKPVESPAVNRLLAGLKVSVVLTAQDGLGAEAVIAANPQVKRLLSMLIDGIRQAYLPLPLDPVGLGARWSVSTTWPPTTANAPPLTASLLTTANVVSLSEREAILSRVVTLQVSGSVPAEEEGAAKVEVSGQGEGAFYSVLALESGLLMGAVGRFEQTQSLQGDISQRVSLSFDLSACQSGSPVSLPALPADAPHLTSSHPLFAGNPCDPSR